MPAIRTETHGHVRRLTLCRPDDYNTITPDLRDALSAAIDDAESDDDIRVILMDAEGPAFCAGYGLDWSTDAQAVERTWDSVQDQQMIGSFAATWAKLHDCSKPTIAAVQGWCIAGGTNIVFNAHLIIAAESAPFGYPPSRVSGIPEAPWTWVARMGLQNARRYMLTGVTLLAVALGGLVSSTLDTETAIVSVAVFWGVAVGLQWTTYVTLSMDVTDTRIAGSMFAILQTMSNIGIGGGDGVATALSDNVGFPSLFRFFGLASVALIPLLFWVTRRFAPVWEQKDKVVVTGDESV